jgi:hypothetical protein
VDGIAVLRNVTIHDVQRGVLVDSGGRATIVSTRIVTDGTGVEVQGSDGQSRVQLISSIVASREPLFGATPHRAGGKLTSIPSWLAVAGALFVLLAALLYLGHRMLVPESHPHHRTRPVLMPTPVGT